MCAQHKCPEPRMTKTPWRHTNTLPEPGCFLEEGDQKRQLPQDPGGEEGNKAWEGAKKTS